MTPSASSLTRRLRHLAFGFTSIGLLTFGNSYLSAATTETAAKVTQPVAVTVTNAVQVQGPVAVQGSVQVQGAVETLNDALNKPYFKRAQLNVASGSYGGEVHFTIPAGKRLVVETIVYSTTTAPGQSGIVFLTSPENINITIPEVGGFDWNISLGHYFIHTGTLTGKLRFDAPKDADATFTMTLDRNTNAGDATFLANVAGYLVDL